MTNQDTINKLVAIKLSAMASAFELQLADSKMRDVPFEDRMAMLVDAEFNTRKSNRLKRLIRLANFDQPDACIANIDYHSGRNISKENILRLASCERLRNGIMQTVLQDCVWKVTRFAHRPGDGQG